MGKGGRRRRPVEGRKRDGTYRKAEHGEELEVDRTRPPTPKHLPAEGRNCFDWIVTALKNDGLLAASDAGLIEAAAVQLMRMRQAARSLKSKGLTVTVQRTVGGKAVKRSEPNPMIKVERDAAKAFADFTSRLGMSPTARASLSGAGDPTGAAPGTGEPVDGPVAELHELPGLGS